jgi:hypothetical protein
MNGGPSQLDSREERRIMQPGRVSMRLSTAWMDGWMDGWWIALLPFLSRLGDSHYGRDGGCLGRRVGFEGHWCAR